MANNVVKFPKSPSVEQRIEMKQHRLRELETENGYIDADIHHLTKAHASNLKEYGKIVKELAALWKLVEPEIETEEVVDFEPDFESDFDFDFDFDLDFNPDDKGDK